MGQQQVPVVAWERMREAGQNGKEVVLEGAYGLFCCIALMNMWWDQLERAVVVSDGLAKCGTGFVIHGVQARCLVGLFEAGKDGLIGCDAVRILFIGKGLDQDSIAVAV